MSYQRALQDLKTFDGGGHHRDFDSVSVVCTLPDESKWPEGVRAEAAAVRGCPDSAIPSGMTNQSVNDIPGNSQTVAVYLRGIRPCDICCLHLTFESAFPHHYNYKPINWHFNVYKVSYLWARLMLNLSSKPTASIRVGHPLAQSLCNLEPEFSRTNFMAPYPFFKVETRGVFQVKEVQVFMPNFLNADGEMLPDSPIGYPATGHLSVLQGVLRPAESAPSRLMNGQCRIIWGGLNDHPNPEQKKLRDHVVAVTDFESLQESSRIKME